MDDNLFNPSIINDDIWNRKDLDKRDPEIVLISGSFLLENTTK